MKDMEDHLRGRVYCTPQQVADWLEISKNVVYALVRKGQLRGFRASSLLQIEIASVEEYIARNRFGGDGQAVDGDGESSQQSKKRKKLT